MHLKLPSRQLRRELQTAQKLTLKMMRKSSRSKRYRSISRSPSPDSRRERERDRSSRREKSSKREVIDEP